MTTIVGISGKMGAGKDYLAGHLIRILRAQGYKVGVSSFAAPLKGEMNDLIARYNEADDVLAADFNIPVAQIRVIKDFIAEDYAAKGADLSAFDRTPGMRSALQYLGTDVRRAVDDQHWVKLYHKLIDSSLDFSFVTDVRFPNEADSVVDRNGVMVRLEISPELLAKRAQARDGFAYDAKAQAHPSEVALDGYGRFDLTYGDEYQIPNVAEAVLNIRAEKI